MKLLQALIILSAGAAGLAMTPATAAPVYRYCMIGTPNSYTSCTFNTFEQCQMTASAGAGFCIESNAYVAARQSGQLKR